MNYLLIVHGNLATHPIRNSKGEVIDRCAQRYVSIPAAESAIPDFIEAHGLQAVDPRELQIQILRADTRAVVKAGPYLITLAEATHDALHPDGECRCAGEGRCDWCLTHCQLCGVRVSDKPLDIPPVLTEGASTLVTCADCKAGAQ